MASYAVEARSLTTLTTLASNPPAYPRNPTHVRHEPLVLYIARVPGSRDVFLSPMKPREKVVTAEDIQSSLYFIHVNQPEDIRLVTPPEPATPSASSPQKPSFLPTEVPKRKPVPGSATLAPVTDFGNRQNISAPNYGHNGRQSTQEHPHVSFESTRYSGEEPKAPQLQRPLEQPGTTLTLIRRDPASNAQWNVAVINDPQDLDISSLSLAQSSPKKKQGSPLYIDITNPGYSKFLHTQERPELMPRNSDLSARSQLSSTYAPSVSISNSTYAPSIAPEQGSETSDNIFRRRIWMENPRSTGGGHKYSRSHDSTMAGARGNWEDPDPIANPSLPMEKQSNFRGYVFTSPWNGRCEFITGAAGTSLKCRHLIPGLQGSTPMSMTVSELRFNLPTTSSTTKSTTKYLLRPPSPSGPAPSFSSSMDPTQAPEPRLKRSSLFHRPRHARHKSNSSVSEMDLSLGQEFAGGGFGGKQAKLGKLIIEDEGLKMLDLLVAANMALWWRAYEKAAAGERPRSRDVSGSG